MVNLSKLAWSISLRGETTGVETIWTRDNMVGSNRNGCEVIKNKCEFPGGSSRVFNKAFWAGMVSKCASIR